MNDACRAICVSCVALVVVASEGFAQVPHGFRVAKPDGAGPYPVAVLLSGCSGFKSAGYEVAVRKLQALGYASVYVDYVGRRTKEGDCASTGIPKSAAAQDFKEAIDWLKTQEFADKSRVVAIGWSYGGGSLLYSLARYAPADLLISKVIAYYPHCEDVSQWDSELPMLVIQAGADDVVSNANCKALIEKSDRFKSTTIVELPGALHAFDMVDLPPSLKYRFGTVGHSQEATGAAWRQVELFLAR